MRLRAVSALILLPILLLLPVFTPLASASLGPTVLAQKTWGGGGDEAGSDVAVDSSDGSIYVTGSTKSFGPGSPTNDSVVLLKYSSAGSLLWQRIWSGPGNGSDVGSGVAVDSSGDVYVAGSTSSYSAGGEDVLLLKFSPLGNLVWQRTWGGVNSDFGFGVAVDGSGNVYVAGDTLSYGQGGANFLLLKFNPIGSLQWQITWGGNYTDVGQSVAVDSAGSNIYVAGYTYSFGAGGDVALLDFSSAGSLLWQRTWGGSGVDFGAGVAVDPSGSVYVAGQTDSFGAGFRDVLLLKFDAIGNEAWAKTWGGGNYDVGDAVALDSFGNIYVTGTTVSYGAGSNDAVLLKFDSAGNLLSHLTWGGSAPDWGYGVAVDVSGSAIVTGYVREAAPYILGSAGNSTLGTPAFAPSAPTVVPYTPIVSAHTPTGTVQTPTGSESYGDAADVFLLKYGVPPTTSLSCGSGDCSIQSNATVSNANFASNALHFTATGSPGTTGCYSLVIPKSAVFNQDSKNIKVFANGTQLPSNTLTITSNATDFFLGFCFTFHSSYNFDISMGVPVAVLAPMAVLLSGLAVSSFVLLKRYRARL